MEKAGGKARSLGLCSVLDDRLNAHSARPQRLSVTLEDELPRHCLRPSAVPRRINPLLFVRGPRGCNTSVLAHGEGLNIQRGASCM